MVEVSVTMDEVDWREVDECLKDAGWVAGPGGIRQIILDALPKPARYLRAGDIVKWIGGTQGVYAVNSKDEWVVIYSTKKPFGEIIKDFTSRPSEYKTDSIFFTVLEVDTDEHL